MSELNCSVVFKKDNHWFTGSLKEGKLRKNKQIKKLSDATNKSEYITLSRWTRENKIDEDYLTKYKVQSLYFKSEPKQVESGGMTEKLFWKKLNELCLSCSKPCKQSSYAIVLNCQRIALDK